jgi:hypothetical protein
MCLPRTTALLRVTLVAAINVAALGVAIPARAAGAEKSSAADCDRRCLGEVLDRYFDSIEKHDPSELQVSGSIRFTENGTELKFGQGLWQRGGPASYRLDAIDPENGQVASDAVITDSGKKAILFVRLRIEKRKITEVETNIVRPGEGQRSDPDSLAAAPPTLYGEAVPPGGRGSREQLISAADAYFASLETGGTDQFKAPPISDDATRVENGFSPRNAGRTGAPRATLPEQLNRGFGGAKLYVSDRRYPVVDLEHGTVLAIGLMHVQPPAGRSDGPPGHATDKPNRVQILVEFFKVAGGQIRQIQATMLDLDDPSNSTSGITNTGWAANGPAQ